MQLLLLTLHEGYLLTTAPPDLEHSVAALGPPPPVQPLLLGHGVSLHGCSSKAQPRLLTLDEGYLLMAAPPDLERGATTPQNASVSSVQLLSHIQLFATP